MEETKQPRLEQLSVKVNSWTLDKWKELCKSGSFTTNGQFMETLLAQYEENYTHPIQVNKENADKVVELERRLVELQTKNAEVERELEEAQNTIGQLRADAAAASEELTAANTRNQALDQERNGCMLVPVQPLDRMCLQFLADRENRQRRRTDITPEVFFMYAVREMLIKGNKFSINSVPDSKIAEFKKQLDNE